MFIPENLVSSSTTGSGRVGEMKRNDAATWQAAVDASRVSAASRTTPGQDIFLRTSANDNDSFELVRIDKSQKQA